MALKKVCLYSMRFSFFLTHEALHKLHLTSILKDKLLGDEIYIILCIIF